MKKFLNRGLAVVLSLVMCVSLLNLTASADAVQCPECKCTGGYHTSDCSKYVDDLSDDKDKKPDETLDEDKDNEKKPVICTGGNHELENGKCKHCGYTEESKPAETETPAPCANGHDYSSDGECKNCGASKYDEPEESQKPEEIQKPEEHVHSWSYAQDYWQFFTHTATCTGCGETHQESCPTERFDYFGMAAVRCSLGCGWQANAEDVHDWSEWKPNNNSTHTRQCGTHCSETATEECRLRATDDAEGAVCTVCGWVKYGDGDSGGKYCPDGEHDYGNVGVPISGETHEQTCASCGHKKTFSCGWSILKDENGPVAHYCAVCGNQKSIRNDGDNQYCDDLGEGHSWGIKMEELSEDGQSVLTTMKCSKCGAVQITDICNSPAKVTVHYVYEGGEPACGDQSQTVWKGSSYSIASPEIKGYECDVAVVEGTCTDGKGMEFTVTYRKVETYTLTVHYEFPGGEEVFQAVTEQHKAGDDYRVVSQPLAGYTPEQEVIEGKMPAADVKHTVKYMLNEYTWTIRYYLENEDEPFAVKVIPFTVKTESLDNVVSPSKEGYTPDQGTVTAPDPRVLTNVESKVVYTGTPTEGQPPETGTDTETEPEPGPEIEIEEPNVPMVEEPEVEITEPEVPLAKMPEEEPVEEPVEIEEPEVPLAEEPDIVEIEDPDVPLADVPQTGDESIVWGEIALISGLGLVFLAIEGKRRTEAEK